MELEKDLVEIQKQQADIIGDIYGKDAEISKAISTSNAPVGYNLSPLVTSLEAHYEKHNVFVKKIARVSPTGATGTKAEWWQINSVTNGMFSSTEGGLGSENTTSTSLIQRDYKTSALTDYVTKEGRISSNGFMDAYGNSVIRGLRKFRQKEEYKILGGNISALTTPSALSVVASSGGSIAAGTYSVKVCAMTAECLNNIATDRNITGLTLTAFLDSAGAAISDRYWGVTVASAADTFTATSVNGTATVTITPTSNAFAYAVFAKVGSDDYTLQKVTSYSTTVLTSYFTTGSTIPTLDGSADILSYDGILPTVLAAANGYGGDNGYAKLNATQTGITEINQDLQGIYDTYGVDATNIYVSGDLRETVAKGVISSGGFYNTEGSPNLDKIVAGRVVGKYIHPATGESIDIETHRYLPKGTYLIMTENVDMPEVGTAQLMEMHTAQDYFQWSLAKTQRRDSFEIFNYAVLGLRAPAWCCVRKNIQLGLAS